MLKRLDVDVSEVVTACCVLHKVHGEKFSEEWLGVEN